MPIDVYAPQISGPKGPGFNARAPNNVLNSDHYPDRGGLPAGCITPAPAGVAATSNGDGPRLLEPGRPWPEWRPHRRIRRAGWSPRSPRQSLQASSHLRS